MIPKQSTHGRIWKVIVKLGERKGGVEGKEEVVVEVCTPPRGGRVEDHVLKNYAQNKEKQEKPGVL